MPEEPIELGKFGFGIKILKDANGKVVFETQSVNQGVPVEMVIMKLRAFLNNLEKDYFDEFSDGTSSLTKK